MEYYICDKCGIEIALYFSSAAYQDGQREQPVRIVIGDDRFLYKGHDCGRW